MFIGHVLSNGDGVIREIDDSLTDLLRRPKWNLIGKSYLELTHPLDRAGNALQVAQLAADGGPVSIRKRYIRGDGTSILTEVKASRYGPPGVGGTMLGSLSLPVATASPRHPYRLWRTATEVLSLDRIRSRELGRDLVADHAWTILMHLYLAEAEGRSTHRSAIAAAANVSEKLAERWIVALEQRGLVEICNTFDACQLSQAGIVKLEAILGRWPMINDADQKLDATSQRRASMRHHLEAALTIADALGDVVLAAKLSECLDHAVETATSDRNAG